MPFEAAEEISAALSFFHRRLEHNNGRPSAPIDPHA
jgi:hypothetical protein